MIIYNHKKGKERKETKMIKYSICTYKNTGDGYGEKYFDTLEEARKEAEKQAAEEKYTAAEIKKYEPYVQISMEEVDEDGEPIEYVDSIDCIYITKAY